MAKILDVPPAGGVDATPEKKQAAEKQLASDSQRLSANEMQRLLNLNNQKKETENQNS